MRSGCSKRVKARRAYEHSHRGVVARDAAVDTGFIVHNEVTYPNLVKLFAELGVETAPSDMSFAVTDHGTGFEYSSRGLNGFFAQRRNALAPAHYKLLREIMRFNREAPQAIDTDVTLGQFVADYDQNFVRRYLYPMAAAVWSMPPEDMNAFPRLLSSGFFRITECWASTLIRGGK